MREQLNYSLKLCSNVLHPARIIVLSMCIQLDSAWILGCLDNYLLFSKTKGVISKTIISMQFLYHYHHGAKRLQG